jgi:uncharacterized membrane protein YdjX (TVP38/TMEM64 family)
MKDDTGGTAGETLRLWVLALVALAALLILHFTPLKSWLDDIREIKAQVDALGLLADVAFVAGSVVAVAIGVPRLALAGLAGALFGFVEGSLLSIVSATLGSYGAFLLARWGGRTWAEHRMERVGPRLRQLLQAPGIWSIVLARQMPAPGLVLNLAFGMLPVTHATFLAGTMIGYVPSTVIVTLAGSSLGKESLVTAIGQISLSLAGLVVLSAVLVWLAGSSGRAGDRSDDRG